MTKNRTNHTFKYNLLLLALFAVFSVGHADAARIYFEPQPATYKVGEDLVLSLFLDTENELVNVVEISILVPELLKIKNISKNGSAIQLWVQEPSFSGKTINLTGGIPGGLNTSKGLVAKISFQAIAVGEGNIAFLPNSSVLLNDGQGTKLDLKMSGGPVFKVIPRPKEVITATPKSLKSQETTEKKEKTKEKKDKQKPEKFEILFGKDPRVFGGENFVSFFTVDPDSGIDRYEIKLGKEGFKVAQAPYLLKDLAPRTVIRVRAYDTQGNYREVVYPDLLKRLWWWITEFIR